MFGQRHLTITAMAPHMIAKVWVCVESSAVKRPGGGNKLSVATQRFISKFEHTQIRPGTGAEPSDLAERLIG